NLVADAAAVADLLRGRRAADHEDDGPEDAVLGLGADHRVLAAVAASAGAGLAHPGTILRPWRLRRLRDRGGHAVEVGDQAAPDLVALLVGRPQHLLVAGHWYSD